MYTLSKGPSKLVQKTRRGLSQIDSLDEVKLINTDEENMKTTNMGFNRRSQDSNPSRSSFNAKRKGRSHDVQEQQQHVTFPGSNNNNTTFKRDRYYQRHSQEKMSPEQTQIVKFIYERWKAVEQELIHGKNSKVIYYEEQETHPDLKDFEPFDLESWWGQRVYRNLTQGHST